MKKRILRKLAALFKKSSHPSAQTAADKIIRVPVTEPFERCVLCGALTSVPVDTHVDFREDYELGCGQLCNACRLKLQQPPDVENLLPAANVLRAIEDSRKEHEKP